MYSLLENNLQPHYEQVRFFMFFYKNFLIMQLHLYNTLSRSKEEFKPINPDLVTIYSCGPTVYSRQHVGNLRAAFVVDLLKNVVKHIA